jgi:hypothetical protein
MTGSFFACLVIGLAPWDDPFKGLALPQPGEERVHGTVRSVDPMDGFLEVEVDGVWDWRGTETFFGKPQTRGYFLESGVRIFAVDKPTAWLTPNEIRRGERLVLIVQLARSGQATAVREVLLPPRKAPAAPRNDIARDLSGVTIDSDGVSSETVVLPLVFPVVGRAHWSDSFLVPRGGGTRRHHGQDLMAPKMTPLVACFDGTVRLVPRGSHNFLYLDSDDGWTAAYMHVNNDTPGTDDGRGTADYAFAPGLKSGDRVVAGQLLAWCGDSGNAEGTAPHLHFELHTPEGHVVNAAPSLAEAERLSEPVVVVPRPDLRPAAGECRLDGVVRQYDKERDVLVVSLIAKCVGAGSKCVQQPVRRYVRLEKADLRRLEGDATAVRTDLAVGGRVTVIGKDPGDGAAVTARLVLAGP